MVHLQMWEMQETRDQHLCREDSLEEEMATHSSIRVWEIPWREEPRGLQSMGSQRVGHDRAHTQRISNPRLADPCPAHTAKKVYYVVCGTDLRSYMSSKELGPEEGIRSSIPSCSFSCVGGLRMKKARGCAGKGEIRARLEHQSSRFPGTRGLILEAGGHAASRTTVATDHCHCLRKMPFCSV